MPSPASAAARNPLKLPLLQTIRQGRPHRSSAPLRLVTHRQVKRLDEARAEVDLSADILNYYADHAATFLAPETLVVDEGVAWVAFQCLCVPKTLSELIT
jgi:hypothetical protein